MSDVRPELSAPPNTCPDCGAELAAHGHDDYWYVECFKCGFARSSEEKPVTIIEASSRANAAAREMGRLLAEEYRKVFGKVREALRARR